MSWFAGKPVEVYRWQRGPELWFVTTSKTEVTVNAEVFLPAYIKRENIRSTGDKGREQINVTMSKDHPLVQPYAAGSPNYPTTVTILRADSDTGEYRFVWAGRVTSAEFQKNEVKMRCEPISTTLRRLGLRRPYQVLCPLVLYDQDSCRAQPVRHPANVVAVNGKILSMNIPGVWVVGAFSGGKIIKGSAVYFVLEHTVDDSGGLFLTLSAPPTDIQASDLVDVVRGCSHDLNGGTGCPSFNNLDNYGGYPYMPQRNPFGLNPIV